MPVGQQQFLAHRQMCQTRQDIHIVEPHSGLVLTNAG